MVMLVRTPCCIPLVMRREYDWSDQVVLYIRKVRTGRSPALEVCACVCTCMCMCVYMCVCVCVMASLWVVTGTQVLTLESLASSNIDDSIDPFTNRLLEFEVPIHHHLTSPVIHIHCVHTGRRRVYTSEGRQRDSEVNTKEWGDYQELGAKRR